MATLYYNGNVDNLWDTLGNWWQDSGATVPATSLPTSTDDVVLRNNSTSTAIFRSSPVTIKSLTLSQNTQSLSNFNIDVSFTADFLDINANELTPASNITINANIRNTDPSGGAGINVFNTGSALTINGDITDVGNYRFVTLNGNIDVSNSPNVQIILKNCVINGNVTVENIGNGGLLSSGEPNTINGNLTVINSGGSGGFGGDGEINGNVIASGANGLKLSYNVNGDATFSGTCRYVRGTFETPIKISGNATFNDDAKFGDDSSSLSPYITTVIVEGDATFNNDAQSSGAVYGLATFNNDSRDFGTEFRNGAIYKNTSRRVTQSGSGNWRSELTSGTIIFKDSSKNFGTGSDVINADFIFEDQSMCDGDNNASMIGVGQNFSITFKNSSSVEFLSNTDNGPAFGGPIIFRDNSYIGNGNQAGQSAFRNRTIIFKDNSYFMRPQFNSPLFRFCDITFDVATTAITAMQTSQAFPADGFDPSNINFEYEKGINGSSILGIL